MKFKPTVKIVQEEKELAWLGKLITKSLFMGQHHFLIEQINDEYCRFVHREVFQGVLATMIWKNLSKNTELGFIKMNEALKNYCESS